MKAVFFSVLALAATSFASPVAKPAAVNADSVVEKRQFDSVGTVLNSFFHDLIGYTGAINATLAALPENPTDADKAAAIAQVGPQLTAITSAINTANTNVQSASASKRAASIERRQAACDSTCLTALVIAFVNELIYTVKSLVTLLGLGGLLGYLTPLFTGLSGLILSLDGLVTGLLLLVTALVNQLLAGLGLALGGL